MKIVDQRSFADTTNFIHGNLIPLTTNTPFLKIIFGKPLPMRWVD